MCAAGGTRRSERHGIRSWQLRGKKTICFKPLCIKACCRYLIKNDMMFVVERDVETHIWKTVYYQVIEMLKSSFLDSENTSPENRKKLKSCLLNLFDEGVDYYTQLLSDLSSTYRFKLKLSLTLY